MKTEYLKNKLFVKNKVYRKARKFIRNPKLFFQDSYLMRKFLINDLSITDDQALVKISEKKNKVVEKKIDMKKEAVHNAYDKFSLTQFKKDIQIGKITKDLALKVIMDLWKKYPWTSKLIKAHVHILELEEKLQDAVNFLELCVNKHNASDDIKMLYIITLRKSGQYNVDITLNLLEGILLKKPLDFNTRYFLCQFLWESQGTSPKLYDHIKFLLQSYKDLSDNQKSFICACLYEFGRYSDVRKYYYLLRDSLEKRYFTLEMMYELEIQKSNINQEIFNKVFAFQNKFEEYIKEHSYIAIVGNAPTEINSGNGALIDSADLVIRFNNFAVGGDFGNDYGYRTDIWVKGGYFQDIQRRNVCSYKGIIQSGNNPLYRNSSFKDFYFDAALTESNFTFIPVKVYYDLIRMIGTSPSAGLAILYWIYLIRGEVPRDWLFGFSFGNQKNNTSEHYFQNHNIGKYYPHSWDKEAEVLRKIISD